MDEERLRSLHRWLYGHFGTNGSTLFVAFTAFLAIALSGLAAYLLRQPLVLLTVGPTAFLLSKAPMAPSSNPRNVIIGHSVGLMVGFVAQAAFGLSDAPGVLEGGAVSPAHVGATALSTALTGAVLMALSAWHPPATVTAFGASLGLLGDLRGLLAVAAGVVLVAAVSWVINRALGVPVTGWGREGPRSREKRLFLVKSTP
jgi:CBS domain-containing membrane protein